MKLDDYLEAASTIPAGETRSFRELAVLAGKPAAARAAGRAIAACPDDERRAWHRVVASDGSLARTPDRARVQLERLRREGARPRANETNARFAERRGVGWIASWATRCYARADDPCVLAWPADRVEPVASAEQALQRGFKPIDRSPAKRASRKKAEAGERATVTSRARDRSHPSSRIEIDPPRATRPSHRARKQTSTDEQPAPSTRAVRSAELRLEPSSPEVEKRLDDLDWPRVRSELGAHGASTVERLLDVRRCRALREMFDAPELFERSIEMAPRGYGIGTYRYFKEPLPEPAFAIRETLYARLVALARTSRSAPPYPATRAEFFEQCRAAGQRRASSILLSYSTGGVNHPHRDIYGKLWFPYQAVLVLSARETEFQGGELLLCQRESDGREHRRALPLDQGDLCVFASRGFETAAPREQADSSAMNGTRARRGKTKTAAKRSESAPPTRWIDQTHGLSPVTRGQRFALGIVLHLAE